MDELKEYVLRAQAGDEDSFQRLYDMYYQKAFYIALKISNFCEADAQDIVQDTFMEIHRSLKSLQKPENFKSWMIRILISKSSHKFRDNRDLFMEPERFNKLEGYIEKRNYMLPNQELNNEIDKKVILQLVDQLKPKQREVLVLQYFEHMSMKEIAEVLEIPEGTVKTRIMYAKNQLKELICEYEKKEGRKLGFQADTLGAVLAAAYLMEYEAMTKAKRKVIIKRKTSHLLSMAYTVGVMLCISVLIGAGIGIYDEWQSRSADHSYVEVRQFQSVVYRNVRITNCRDAYYTLKEWAQNPQRMALRSAEEKDEIRPVYEALKQYQGVYYEKLIRDKWTIAFESDE